MLRFSPVVKPLVLSVAVAALTACGGGGGGGGSSSGNSGDVSSPAPAPAAVQQGVFLDSAVSGLYYETDSLFGYTGVNGEFSYKPGESVRFYLGSTLLGETIAQDEVTPLDLITSTDGADKLQNMLRTLQTLDEDSDPSNGIQINNIAQNYLDQYVLPINQPAVMFEASQVIQEMIASVTNGTGLKDSIDSLIHFRETLLLSRRNVSDTVLLNLLGTTWDAEISSTACPSDATAKVTYKFNSLGLATSGYHRLNTDLDEETGEPTCKKAGYGVLFNTYETDVLFTCANQCVDADLNRVILDSDENGDVVTAMNYDPINQQITIRETRSVDGEDVTTTKVLTKR
ncbi:MAG TPA: hypothetical protein VM553_20865 [Dongiaceae bacterium]|nr:hypothetical protein [Dongiaceae bacterium]